MIKWDQEKQHIHILYPFVIYYNQSTCDWILSIDCILPTTEQMGQMACHIKLIQQGHHFNDEPEIYIYILFFSADYCNLE